MSKLLSWCHSRGKPVGTFKTVLGDTTKSLIPAMRPCLFPFSFEVRSRGLIGICTSSYSRISIDGSFTMPD